MYFVLHMLPPTFMTHLPVNFRPPYLKNLTKFIHCIPVTLRALCGIQAWEFLPTRHRQPSQCLLQAAKGPTHQQPFHATWLPAHLHHLDPYLQQQKSGDSNFVCVFQNNDTAGLSRWMFLTPFSPSLTTYLESCVLAMELQYTEAANIFTMNTLPILF